MSNPQVILYIAAFVVLIIGALDHPRFSALRCIALGVGVTSPSSNASTTMINAATSALSRQLPRETTSPNIVSR